MQKEYPNTIYLYIEERKTVAAMQWLGILYTLDREGVVMEESTSTTPAAGHAGDHGLSRQQYQRGAAADGAL